MLRYLRTLRYLKPGQILGRVIASVNRGLCPYPPVGRDQPSPYPGCRWAPDIVWPRFDYQAACGEKLKSGYLTFLNEQREVGWPPDWTHESGTTLWDYHLFYFDYLWASDFEAARQLLSAWLRSEGNRRIIAWDPYPVSLRLTNLCGYFFGAHREEVDAAERFRSELWGLIEIHANWLDGHLEYHLMGNHLFENAASLVLAGSCFEGRDAERWLHTGVKVLSRELPEQILPDGMHFERSPMYHMRLMQTLLMLSDTGNPEVVRLVLAPLRRMADALVRLVHPDGDIALLNDSSLGQYGTPKATLGNLNSPPEFRSSACFALPDAGYYGWRDEEGSYLICDAGPLGPDYIPGHAHGDMLSFELSLNGQRVIVDSGLSTYEGGEVREHERSTAAHNTVEIDGTDQSEFWAVFRVGRRAQIHDVAWNPSDDGFELSASHDGYRRVSSRAKHERQFKWHRANGLVLHDHVVAGSDVRCISRLHLHPSCNVEVKEDGSALVTYCGSQCIISFEGEGTMVLRESTYSSGFGVRSDSQVLEFVANGRDVSFVTRIEPVKSHSRQ